MKLSLTVKFNLVFVAVFAAGLAAAGWFADALLQRNARDETVQNARVMMEYALAVRRYTQDQIVPLLQQQLEVRFLPQSVPSFSATESINNMRAQYPDYAYKEATLNPTNPRDRAAGWEVDVVQSLRDHPALDELTGVRETPTGPSMYVARPIRISDPKCLVCHSTVDAAPKPMVAVYGPNNGFGWKLNDVIGAQIVSVPAAVPLARARDAFQTVMLLLGAVFAVTFLVFNLMFHAMVTRRVVRLSKAANEVSLGRFDGPDFKAGGGDEIGVLAESFSRMRRSLASALKMLED